MLYYLSTSRIKTCKCWIASPTDPGGNREGREWGPRALSFCWHRPDIHCWPQRPPWKPKYNLARLQTRQYRKIHETTKPEEGAQNLKWVPSGQRWWSEKGSRHCLPFPLAFQHYLGITHRLERKGKEKAYITLLQSWCLNILNICLKAICGTFHIKEKSSTTSDFPTSWHSVSLSSLKATEHVSILKCQQISSYDSSQYFNDF